MNLSTLAFIGALATIGFVVFNKVSPGKGILIGGGLLAVGFALQPNSGTGVTS